MYADSKLDCSFAVLVTECWFFSCCGLFSPHVQLRNRGGEMYKNILSVLLPRNGKSFSSHSIFSCLFSLGVHFQACLQGVKSQVTLLQCVKTFKTGLFCILKIIPLSCVSENVPKYRFCLFFFFSILSKPCGLNVI